MLTHLTSYQRRAARALTALALGGLLLDFGLSKASAAPVEPYETGRVALGGGGFVTGIQFSPLVKDRLFARGDVTGFFKWVPDTKTLAGGHWKQLLDFFPSSEILMYGCLDFAFDPVEPDTMYASFGISGDPYGGSSSPGIYKSTDAGETWTKIFGIKVSANSGGARTFGHALAVDPNNNKVIYFGSEQFVDPWSKGGPTPINGLYVTTDGGKNWAASPSAPTGPKVDVGNLWTAQDGIRTVLPDPRSGTVVVNGIKRTRVIYLGVRASKDKETPFDGGLFVSKNGGQTFSLVPGTPKQPRNIYTVGKTGDKLIMTTDDAGIMVYAKGVWAKTNGGGTDIAIDPTDNNKMIADGNNSVSRSTDGGLTWAAGKADSTDSHIKYADNLWMFDYASYGTVAFDPFRPGQAWEANCFNVWRTRNVWQPNATWNLITYGLETTCSLWMECPPAPSKNLLYYSCQDVRGFQWQNISVYPAKISPDDPGSESGTYDRSWAECEQHPDHVMALMADPPKAVFFSADDGKTWVQQNNPPNTQFGHAFQGVVSSSNPDHVLFLDQFSKPWYATNAFTAEKFKLEWTQSAITYPDGYVPTEGDNYDANVTGLIADKSIGEKFYLDTHDPKGKGNNVIFVSIDGGKTFHVPAGQTIPWSGPARLLSSPGIPNDLWALVGGGERYHPGAVYHSTDGAKTWETAPGMKDFSQVQAFAIGKNAPGSKKPAIYALGPYKGDWGIYRSNDLGATFDPIAQDKTGRGYSNTWCMAADRHVYGRVYLNTDGTGVSYLQIKGSPMGTATTVSSK